MSKSLVEFKRFLLKSGPSLSEYEKKLANLMLDSFDEISAVGSAGGRRGKVLSRLIVEKGEAVNSELNIEQSEAGANESEIVRLTKLDVEHFRGFSDKHSFEFKNPYTFIYGPNGTGKSSLCEALEFGLLGSIHEADSKRIPVADYIRNATSKRSLKPILYGDTAQEKGVEVKADARSFEFCFIEKNRIDGFARVSANTPAAQQARLAALFGLEDFNTFATQFNDSIEAYVTALVGKKGSDLAERAKVLAGHKTTLEGLPAKVEAAEARKISLLSKYPGCKDLEEIKALLIGPEGNTGRQKANNTEIGRLQNLKTATDPGVDGILSGAEELLQLIEEKKLLEAFLNQFKDQLSLRNLYAAIQRTREKFENECPACASELYRDGRLMVPVDPYINADEQLVQFDAALRSEERINEILDTFNLGWRNLLSEIAKLPASAAAVGFAKTQDIASFTTQASDVEDASGIERFLRGVPGLRALLLELKGATTIHNDQVEQSRALIKTLDEDNLSITKDLEEIAAIFTLVRENDKSEQESMRAIEAFNQENEELIREAAAEKPGIDRGMRYSIAYDSLRKKLQSYNVGLPLALATDLNEKTLRFYNEINQYDHPSDRLKSLRLPTTAGGADRD
tara:strand:+ start:5250 stop:7127 length:1878 start_codon:yes stop_codon:yes gene_type:complete